MAIFSVVGLGGEAVIVIVSGKRMFIYYTSAKPLKKSECVITKSDSPTTRFPVESDGVSGVIDTTKLTEKWICGIMH